MKINTTYLAIGLAFLGLPIALKSIAYLPIALTFFVLAFIIPPEEDDEDKNHEEQKDSKSDLNTKN